MQQFLRDALDAAPTGPIGVISMCAGEARDLTGALDGHPRARDMHGCVVELDPDLALTARLNLPPKIEVVVGDAGMSTPYEQTTPANLVVACGVFGNITDADTERAVRLLPMFCAPGAAVVWTRHRRPPDLTVKVREWFAKAGFEEIGFIAPEDSMFTVGAHRFAGVPESFRPHQRVFSFVGYEALGDVCRRCGFSYDVGRAEIIPWLRADTTAFVDRLRRVETDDLRRRPAPDVWSALEYACHVRDVLRVQRDRVLLAQTAEEPVFAPMRRDERAVEERYNEQDLDVVVDELIEVSRALVDELDRLDDAGWRRTGIYNCPSPQSRTVEWIAIHTSHELLHHRVDIGNFA